MKKLGKRIFEFYWGSGLADEVPALTYYLFISLAPFTLGLVAISVIAFGDYLTPAQISETVSELLPDKIRPEITKLVENTKEQSSGLLVIAIAVMLWTSAGAIGIIERTLSKLAELERHGMVVNKLRHLALGGVVAILVMASAASAGIQSGILRLFPELDISFGPGAALTQYLGSLFTCGLIFYLAPMKRLHLLSCVWGGAFAGFAVQTAPYLVGKYLQYASSLTPASLFLSLGVVVAGCFLMAQGILIGAGFAAKWERRYTTDEG